MVPHPSHHQVDQGADRNLDDLGVDPVAVMGSVHADHDCPVPGECFARDFDVASLTAVVGSVTHDDNAFDCVWDVGIDQHPVPRRPFESPGLNPVVPASGLSHLLDGVAGLVREVQGHRSRIRTSSRRTEPARVAFSGDQASWIVEGCPISSP